MEVGPIPLAEALQYARAVANHLRELHEEGRVHGEVSASMVVLRHSGILLMAPGSAHTDAGSLGDVTAFGAMLYEMLTSRKPTTEALLSTPLQAPPRKGPGAVYSAAVRLAERCVTAVPENAPTMQKVLTELRLLSVQAKQWDPEDRPALIAKAEILPAITVEQQPADETALAPKAKLAEEEDLLADGRCPRCRCSKVRVSRPRNRIERFLRAIGLPIRRCHRCYFRYIDLFKACLEMPTKKFNK